MPCCNNEIPKKERSKPIPERTSSCCSLLLFTWFTPLTNTEIRSNTDVWTTPVSDSSKHQTLLLEKRIEYEKKKGTSPRKQLLYALVKTRGWEWLACSFLKLTGELAQYVLPILLNELIKWMENRDGRSYAFPLYLSIILLTVMMFRTFVMAFYVNLTCRVGLTRKTAFMGVIFNKVVKLNATTASINAGTLINILGNDAEKMSMGSRLFQNAWFQPVAVVICMTLLIHYIGVSALVGLFLMLLLLPLQIKLASKLTKLRRALLLKSDKRISVINNLILGIRAIKLLTWEKFILQDINKKRLTEMNSLKDYLTIK
jgi:ABC-type multidrug transport system fused ATPase/permease subunit